MTTAYQSYVKSVDDHNALYEDQDDELCNAPFPRHKADDSGEIRGLGRLAPHARYGYHRAWEKERFHVNTEQRMARSAWAKAQKDSKVSSADAVKLYGRWRALWDIEKAINSL